MQLSNSVSHRTRCWGFTLIELLVVICIISIVSGAVLLSIHHNKDKRLQAFGSEFMQMMALAEEQAMLQPATIGVYVRPHSLQFVRYQPVANSKAMRWVPLTGALSTYAMPKEVQVVVKSQSIQTEDSDEEIHLPQIIISPNGDMIPFSLYISSPGDAPRYVIRGDENGNLTSQ
jgi:type II secretion system protein H